MRRSSTPARLLRDLRDNPSAHRAGGPPHILVVDDDQPVRQLLRQELEGHGYVVHEAADGHEAVRMARALGPDLVTLDVMMPDVNGFDVAQALRHDPATLRIPILVVSVVHDEVRATAVGVDRYLTKPVDGADLHAQVEALLAEGGRHGHVVVADSDRPTLETLQEILVEQGWVVTPASDPAYRGRGGPDRAPRPGHRPGRPGRPVPPGAISCAPTRSRSTSSSFSSSEVPVSRSVLIVDDEAHIRALLEQTLEELEDEGVELMTAADGAAALALIAAERPDLVFLDVMMPRMNGYEVCRAVRSDLGLTDVTIVLLTAKGQDADRVQGLAVGADEFRTKPFDPDEILDLARARLGPLDETR